MRTLAERLREKHRRIEQQGGKVPVAVGSLERQLCECDAEIRRLRERAPREATVESYRLLGLTEAEAKIAAGVEKGVRSKNLNKLFDSALALGLSEAEARVFANPELARPEEKL